MFAFFQHFFFKGKSKGYFSKENPKDIFQKRESILDIDFEKLDIDFEKNETPLLRGFSAGRFKL